MKIKGTKTDLIWAILGTGLNLMMGVIVLPVMLVKVSESDMGIWYVLLAIQNLIGLLDFGFSPTYTRNVIYAFSGVKQISKDTINLDKDNVLDGINYQLLYSMLIMGRKIYRILSLIALVVLSTAGIGYYYYILPDKTSAYYYIAFAVFTVAMVINIYYTYLPSYMKGIGAVKESYIAYVISRVAYIVCGIGLLFAGLGLLGMVISLFVSGLLLRVSCMFLIKKYCKANNLVIPKDTGEYTQKELFKTMLYNVKKEGLITISNFITSQSSTFICTAYYGTVINGRYGFTLQVINIVASVAMLYFSINMPRISQARVDNNLIDMKRLFCKSMAFMVLIFICGIVGVCLVGPWFLRLIQSNTQLLSIPVVICFAITIFLEKYYSLCASFISTSNKLPYTVSYIVTSILILIGMLVLPKLSNWGVILFSLVQLVLQACYNDWKWTTYVGRELQVNPLLFPIKGIQYFIEDIKNIRKRKIQN